MDEGGRSLEYVMMIGSKGLAAYLFFSAYHWMQLATASKIKSLKARSLIWAAVFFLALPILVSPLLIGTLFVEGIDQDAYAPIQHPLWMILAALVSLAVGWFASFYPQRSKLREIGAWGIPEGDSV